MPTKEEIITSKLKGMLPGLSPVFIPSPGKPSPVPEPPGTVHTLYGVIRPPMGPPVKLPPRTPIMLYGIPVRPPGRYEPPVAHPLYGVPSRPLPPGYAIPMYGIPNPGHPPSGAIIIQDRRTGKMKLHPGHRY